MITKSASNDKLKNYRIPTPLLPQKIRTYEEKKGYYLALYKEEFLSITTKTNNN